MERSSYPSQKDPTVKRSQRRVKDESIAYWNDQRVVPRKVDGKMTYVIISGALPSDECDGKGCRGRRQELFPSEVRRNITVDSRLQLHTEYRNSADPTAAAGHRVNISVSKCHENKCGEGHDKPCRLYVHCSSSVGGSGELCVTQSFEQQTFTSENPSTTCDTRGTSVSVSSSSYHHTAGIHKHSTARVLQHLNSGDGGLELSPNLLDSATGVCNI